MTQAVHQPSAQGDGDPGVSRQDVALAICVLVATAREAGVPLLAVLGAVAETWDEHMAPLPAQSAADRITG